MIWGTGKPRRELMHVDDLANGILFLLQVEDPPDWVNLGTGTDHSIQRIAELVKESVGYDGAITNDPTKPDGTPLKRLDVSLAQSLGWSASIPLEKGLISTYEDFMDSIQNQRLRS